MVIRHNTQCFRVDLMCIDEDEVPHIHIPEYTHIHIHALAQQLINKQYIQ